MKYRRIDKDTVQCIVTNEDLEEYGLKLSDIFERNERGEDFLRDLIEEAHNEVGYNCNGNSIAMQIRPLRDNGMVITFSEEPEGTFRNFLEHMKEVLPLMQDLPDAIHELQEMGMHIEESNVSKASSSSNQKKSDKAEEYAETRIFEFSSMSDVLFFCEKVSGANQIKSCLVKADDYYYLVMMKNRMSWKNYNKLSAKAFEFSRIIVDAEDKLLYLGEHGEIIIENGAVNKLSKLGK